MIWEQNTLPGVNLSYGYYKQKKRYLIGSHLFLSLLRIWRDVR